MEPNQTIGTFFAKDHHELDIVFAEVRQDIKAASKGDVKAHDDIRERFQRFHRGLDRHIRWEEEILFPAVEAKEPGLEHGPGRVMRDEHREIRQLLGDVDELLRHDQPHASAYAAAADALERTLIILGDHNEKEEVVYYPTADEVFTPDEARAILDRVSAMS